MTAVQESAVLERINELALADAVEAFFRCCGVMHWAQHMAAARPYASWTGLEARADALWRSFTESDWREAFAHHPRIGDRDSLRARFAATGVWAEAEQAGAFAAAEAVLDALATENDAYFERFGYIFLVCATGKSAAEMLSLLRGRLPNPPEVEIQIAAGEQKKITRLRLRKL